MPSTSPSPNVKTFPSEIVKRPLPLASPLTRYEQLAIGEYIARGFDFNYDRADNSPLSWYQEQLGPGGVCSTLDALHLRMVTLRLCRERNPIRTGPGGLSITTLPATRETPANQVRRAALIGSLPDRYNAGVVTFLSEVERGRQRAVFRFVMGTTVVLGSLLAWAVTR